MAVVVIVGAQWGDEGKGKVVDLFTQHADVVVRWGGGANAGHTLVVGDKKYVTHLVPSGVLRHGAINVLGEGMVIDPTVLIEEVRGFRSQGLLVRDEELVIAERAHVTLPYHRLLDRLREQRPGAIGTTQRGIGPTYESKASRVGLRVGDLLRPERFRRLLERNLELLGPIIDRMGGERPNLEQIASAYLAIGDEIRPFVRDASRLVNDSIRAGKNVLFEGAHGVLLDLDHGTYPFVTSSSTTAGGACSACGIAPTFINSVVGIAKAYTTRVGLGPFPTELDNAIGEQLRRVGAEFGSTTGRPRRCGWLDVAGLRLTARLSGIQGFALTKLDVLAGLEKVRICVGYRLGGKLLDELPLDQDDLAAVEPVYEDHPGWPATKGGDLPDAARRYVERITALTGVPVWLMSVGPGRDQTVVVRNPFTA